MPVIYDSTPGGSGHAIELAREDPREVRNAPCGLSTARFADHDAICRSACLRCLLSFDTQHVYPLRLLDWRAAAGILRRILPGAELQSPWSPIRWPWRGRVLSNRAGRLRNARKPRGESSPVGGRGG